MTIQNTNPMTAIITAVMRDTQTSANRSADMVVAMFASEATYSRDNIIAVLRKEGEDKTEALNRMLCNISDDFSKTLDEYERRIDKDYKKSLGKGSVEYDNNAFTVLALRAKIKAAHEMLKRSMLATLNLRTNKCEKVKRYGHGAGVLIARMIGPKDKEDAYPQELSVSALVRAGEIDLAKATGKVKAKPEASKARNPAASVLADGAKSLATVLTSLAVEGNRKPITDYSDEIERDLEAIGREFFLSKFYDGTTFDVDAFDVWRKEVDVFAKARPQRKPGDVADVNLNKPADSDDEAEAA